MSASFTTVGTGILAAARQGAYGGGVAVVVGSVGASFSIESSPDGTTWTGRSGGSTVNRGVAYSSSQAKFMVDSGATSPDGTTWTAHAIAPYFFPQCIARSEALGLWVACGESYSAYYSAGPNYAIWTSPDGTTWTGRYVTTHAVDAVAWSPALGKFVAWQDNGLYLTSTNGTSWSSAGASALDQVDRIRWCPNNGIFVAVGYGTGGGSTHVRTAYKSSDGSSWTALAEPYGGSTTTAELFDVCEVGRALYVCGNRGGGIGSKVFESTDTGASWAACTTPVDETSTTVEGLFAIGTSALLALGGSKIMSASNPDTGAAAAAALQIAFSNNAYDTNPTWVDVTGVTGWSTSRGRNYELSRTQAGTATVTVVDTAGKYDPTGLASPYLGSLAPMKQARIRQTNPVTGDVSTIFKGFVESWTYEIVPTENLIRITINLVDGFDLLANAEVPVGNNASGSVTYRYATVEDRIKAALADGDWPTALTNIFSGNVYMQAFTYEAGHDILSVIQDASDAEFPGIANFYMSKDGVATFHGRFARFQPANYASYGISTWNAGDKTAVDGNAGWARINTLEWAVDKTNLVNACLITPEGIAMTDVPGQLVVDATSVGQYGVRSLKFEGLQVAGGIADGLDGKGECLLYSNYWISNYAQPQTRIQNLVFKTVDPLKGDNAATWALMCGVEIGDLIYIRSQAPGSGGFQGQGFFVEGIRNTVSLGNGSYPQWTVQLDVSPQKWFDRSPAAAADAGAIAAPPESNMAALEPRFRGVRR